MTITRSGLLVATVRNNMIGGTATSLVHAGNKITFFTDALVVDFAQSSPVYNVSPYNVGEASGLGFPSGGVTMDTPTLTHTTDGLLKWAAGTVSILNTTVSGITGAVVYANGQSDRVIAVIYAPGGPHETQDGELGIEWDPLGIADWDLVPA